MAVIGGGRISKVFFEFSLKKLTNSKTTETFTKKRFFLIKWTKKARQGSDSQNTINKCVPENTVKTHRSVQKHFLFLQTKQLLFFVTYNNDAMKQHPKWLSSKYGKS